MFEVWKQRNIKENTGKFMKDDFSGIMFKIPDKNIIVKQKFRALTPIQYFDFISSGNKLLCQKRNFKKVQCSSLVPTVKFKL